MINTFVTKINMRVCKHLSTESVLKHQRYVLQLRANQSEQKIEKVWLKTNRKNIKIVIYSTLYIMETVIINNKLL